LTGDLFDLIVLGEGHCSFYWMHNLSIGTLF